MYSICKHEKYLYRVSYKERNIRVSHSVYFVTLFDFTYATFSSHGTLHGRGGKLIVRTENVNTGTVTIYIKFAVDKNLIATVQRLVKEFDVVSSVIRARRQILRASSW